MYTDFEIERIYLGLPIAVSNGSGNNGNGGKKHGAIVELPEFSHEELEELCLGLPFS